MCAVSQTTDLKPSMAGMMLAYPDLATARRRRDGCYGIVSKTPSARLTQEGSVCGTPLYMSPKQARGLHGLDARSDIYTTTAVPTTALSFT